MDFIKLLEFGVCVSVCACVRELACVDVKVWDWEHQPRQTFSSYGLERTQQGSNGLSAVLTDWNFACCGGPISVYFYPHSPLPLAHAGSSGL